MRGSTRAFLAGLLLVVVAAVTSGTVAAYATGDLAELALWAFFAVIFGSATFGCLMIAFVVLRSSQGGFRFLKSAEDSHRLAKMMMWVSAALMVVALFFGVRTTAFLLTARPTTGTLVELMQRESDDGDVQFAPVYTFVDSDGRTHRVLSSTASYPPIGLVGDDVPVLYDPQNPANAEINRFFYLWGVSVITGGLGTFYFIVCWIVAAILKRKMRSRKQGCSSITANCEPSAET